MNRIIIIGNGFDLAHEMKTSYRQFIDYYWKNCIEEIEKLPVGIIDYDNDEINIKIGPLKEFNSDNYNDFNETLKKEGKYILFKNLFFKIITEKSHLQNWVDIENEYYDLLKSTFSSSKSVYGTNIQRLNSEFESVKNKLIEYLKKEEKKFNENQDKSFLTTKDIIGHKIYHPFMLRDFSELSLNQKAEIEYNLIKEDLKNLVSGDIQIEELNETERTLINRIDIKKPLQEIKKLLKSDYANEYFDLIPQQTVFLNFNYTFTEKTYTNPREFDKFDRRKFTSVESIHIHGTTKIGDNNPVIFGFGDEIDDDYKSIEKLNDNNYLENIKSINYLETDSYRKLLEYINSENFQIFIFGHSCGVSDRTLLNTIFEHENCASIKVFYHQKDNGSDNYSDIVRNISRNFNDKAKMREKVVNKNYCEKLM